MIAFFQQLIKTTRSSNPIIKVLGILVGLVVLIGLLMFSAVLILVFLCFASIAAIYVWWKIRKIKQQREIHAYQTSFDEAMQQRYHYTEDGKGNIIDGEVVHKETPPILLEHKTSTRHSDFR